MQEDIHVINVMDFVRAGETAVQGFTAMYEFLCDVSHPTYMHSFLYWLKVDASWSNDHNAREMHRILEKVPKAAEMAIGGISTAMIEIYDECVPDLEKEITSYRPWTNTNVDQEPTAAHGQNTLSRSGTARAFWYCRAVPGKAEIGENNRVVGSSC